MSFYIFLCLFKSNQPKVAPISLAAGTIDKIISAEEIIKNIIKDAEILLGNLGFQQDLVDFTKL
ncbi:MAG: hypothetical protein ACFFAQ_12135 [Promethearchaeota archaeon]